MSSRETRGDDRFVFIFARRLTPILLAGLLIVPLAGPVSAYTVGPPEVVTDEVLAQSALDLVLLANRQRDKLGLVALRADPKLMAIARDRAQVMAANDEMSHMEPNGQKVFDRMNAAGFAWYGAGEIIAWNNYPTEPLSVAESIYAWMHSPSHREIMVSTGYNYVGFGAAVSATGKRYYAGLYAKEPDQTKPVAKFHRTLKRSSGGGHVRVKIRWSGHDTRLQVLTSGLRYYQVEWRHAGGVWHSWGKTRRTAKYRTWVRGKDYQVRVRARDRAGNWGDWKIKNVSL